MPFASEPKKGASIAFFRNLPLPIHLKSNISYLNNTTAQIISVTSRMHAYIAIDTRDRIYQGLIPKHPERDRFGYFIPGNISGISILFLMDRESSVGQQSVGPRSKS